MKRLDIYETRPPAMEQYLRNYGWHFSKKMYEFAIEQMVDRNGNKIRIFTKDEIDAIFRQNGIDISYNGYDAIYLFCMAKCDFYGDVLPSDSHICRFVKAYLEDKDGYNEIAFTRFYADTVAKSIPIIWEDVL